MGIHYQPKVSIIIPVYRGKEGFAVMLSALRGQTLQDIEIITVDDCGGDGTFDIAMEAAREDSRVVCLHNETNRGPGYSRNRGIAAAKGEYIAFADADDFVPPNYYQLLYEKALQTDALVVKGSRVYQKEDGSIISSPLNGEIMKRLAGEKTMLTLFVYEHQSAIYNTALVRETGAVNADARQDEDTVFLCMLMSHVPPARFALQEQAVYYYRSSPSSLSSLHSSAYLNESIKSMQCKVAYLITLPPTEEIGRYAATLYEERIVYRMRRIPDMSRHTAEQKEAYYAAVRESMVQFYSRYPQLAMPTPGMLMVAMGVKPDPIIEKLQEEKEGLAFPAKAGSFVFRTAIDGKMQACRFHMKCQICRERFLYIFHRILALVSSRQKRMYRKHAAMAQVFSSCLRMTSSSSSSASAMDDGRQ